LPTRGGKRAEIADIARIVGLEREDGKRQLNAPNRGGVQSNLSRWGLDQGRKCLVGHPDQVVGNFEGARV